MITETLIVLKDRIQELTGVPVFLVDTKVAAIDKNAIYMVTPQSTDISITPFMSSAFEVNYDVHIYQVIHVTDVSRQKDIKMNVIEALNQGTNLLGRAFDLRKKYRNVAGANLVDMEMGTDTWVVNTTLYTSYDLRISFKAIKDN